MRETFDHFLWAVWIQRRQGCVQDWRLFQVAMSQGFALSMPNGAESTGWNLESKAIVQNHLKTNVSISAKAHNAKLEAPAAKGWKRKEAGTGRGKKSFESYFRFEHERVIPENEPVLNVNHFWGSCQSLTDSICAKSLIMHSRRLFDSLLHNWQIRKLNPKSTKVEDWGQKGNF